MRKSAVAMLVLVCVPPAVAQTPVPVASRSFPCRSFHREADGSWKQVAPITVLNVTVTSVGYEKDSKEALSLDRRCAGR